MDNKAVAAKFGALIEAVFSKSVEKIDDQLDFDDKYQRLYKDEYAAAIKILIEVKDAKLLVELMKIYLAGYQKYSANKNAVRFYRSDQLFFLLVERSAQVTDPSLFETWDAALSDKSDKLTKRAADLSKTVASQVESFRLSERKKRYKTRSILDLLKDEYTRKKEELPPNNNALYAFDPRPEKAGKYLDNQLAFISKHWDAAGKGVSDNWVAMLNGALNSFREHARTLGAKDVLSLFQIAKGLQDLTRDKVEIVAGRGGREEKHRTSVGTHAGVLYFSLYAIVCVELGRAGLMKLFARNGNGLTNDEIDYFIKPVREAGFKYRSNVLKFIGTPSLGPEERRFDAELRLSEVKGFLGTYALTQSQLSRLTLVELDKTLEIQRKWELIRNLTDAISMASRNADVRRVTEIFTGGKYDDAISSLKEISSTTIDTQNKQVLGQGRLAAGASVGSDRRYGDVSIVYIDPKNKNYIYVEFASLKPQLFLAPQGFIDNHFYGAMIMEIYRSTIGIVQLTEVIFMAMGFMPVLIEAGFAGLIYEIVVFFVTDKIGEQAAKINPAFGVIVSTLLQTFSPRPNFKTKIKDTRTSVPDQTGLSDALRGTSRDNALVNRTTTDQKALNKPTSGGVDAKATNSKLVESSAKDSKLSGELSGSGASRGYKRQDGKNEAAQDGIELVENKTRKKGSSSAKKSDRSDSRGNVREEEGAVHADVDAKKSRTASNIKKERAIEKTSVSEASRAKPEKRPYKSGLDTPEKLTYEMRDNRIYRISNLARRSEGIANNVDIADLGKAIGKHLRADKRGNITIDPNVADALWSLPADLRGVLIERALGTSHYKEWLNVGAQKRGFFPQADFSRFPEGASAHDLVSLKTVDPLTKSYGDLTQFKLYEHVEDIVANVYKMSEKGHGLRNFTLDVRIPRGAAAVQADFETALRAAIPSELRKYVKVYVRVF